LKNQDILESNDILKINHNIEDKYQKAINCSSLSSNCLELITIEPIENTVKTRNNIAEK
jgi:hypothetical protein